MAEPPSPSLSRGRHRLSFIVIIILELAPYPQVDNQFNLLHGQCLGKAWRDVLLRYTLTGLQPYQVISKLRRWTSNFGMPGTLRKHQEDRSNLRHGIELASVDIIWQSRLLVLSDTSLTRTTTRFRSIVGIQL